MGPADGGKYRRQQEFILAGQFLGFGAVLGRVLQDGVDGAQQLGSLLKGGIVSARVNGFGG